MSNGILVEVVHGSDDSTVELPFAGDTDVVEDGATAPCSEPRFDRRVTLFWRKSRRADGGRRRGTNSCQYRCPRWQ